MTHIRTTIARYQLTYHGKRNRDIDAIADIRLYNDNSRTIGNVSFYRDGQQIPTNVLVENRDPKIVLLSMHERQLDTVVDMLRNEKPCSLYWSGRTFTHLYTGLEPIGEEELEA